VGGQRGYDEQILRKLLESFANNQEYYIILKPHPAEKYLESYKAMIKQYDGSNFVIKQGNLFELLYAADVVISVFSTTLVDSILLNKATIRVTFLGTEVVSLFTEYGVFLETTLDLLPKNMIRLLSDTKLRNELTKNREKFVHDQYNIPNPKAIEQLKSIIGLH
jgi:CDP-glycerol glycerophosphotransferase (TagB/SpsB family)